MARITVEDCLDHVENRFALVMVAAKRSRQLSIGGKQPMVEVDSDKVTVVALREIAEGLVTDQLLSEPEVDYDEEVSLEAAAASALEAVKPEEGTSE